MPTQPRQSRPATILLYVLLQSLATGFMVVPIPILFRDISYTACKFELGTHTTSYTPETDPCRHVSFRAGVTLFYAMMGLFSFLSSGPLAKLLDKKDVKSVMAIVGTLNACGDIWLYTCARILPQQRTAHAILFAAVLKGLGGAPVLAKAAYWTYIENLVPLKRRSTYFSLSLFVGWCGYRFAATMSTALPQSMDMQETRLDFQLSIGLWLMYTIGAVALLHHEPDPTSYRFSLRTFGRFLWSTLGPLGAMFSTATVFLLAVAYMAVSVATFALRSMITLTIQRYHDESKESHAGLNVISHVLGGAILLQFAVALIVTPFFVSLYQRLFREDTQDTQVLSEYVWSQEFTVSRVGLFAGAVGILLVIISSSPSTFIYGSYISTLSFAAMPSIMTMVTLIAEQNNMGTTLTGFALMDWLITLFSECFPTILRFSGLSYERLPPTTELSIAVALLTLGGITTFGVRRSLSRTRCK